MHNIKTKHTDNMVFDLWNKTYDNVQGHINYQLHHNIQHPLWVQMRNHLVMQMQEQIQNRMREECNDIF